MRFEITLTSYSDIAKEVLKGWQYKVYLMKVRSLLAIFSKKLAKFRDTEEKDKRVFCIENDDIKVLEQEKKELEAFLYSDSSKLGGEGSEEFQAIKNDRLIQKLNKSAHKFTARMKDKAIKSALGGTDVLGFLLRIGINVEWKIIK